MSEENAESTTGNSETTATQTTDQPNQATEKPWYGEDEAIKGLVEAKGWKEPKDALQSYQNLEKVFGADKAGRALVIPKDAADADGWNEVYTKLGKPASPDEYKLPVPEGDDGSFAKSVAPILHKANLTAAQAQTLATEWNAFQAAQIEANEKAMTMQGEQEISALKTEWGNAYDQNTELARRAFKTFGEKAGLDADVLTRVEKEMGTGKMLKMFSEIGKLIAEDEGVGFQGGSGDFKLTPAAAKNRIDALKADGEWSKKYLAGDADAKKEWEMLHKAAYPNQ